MHICYLILAHKEPQQVARLVGRLQAEGSFFYVHIDRSADEQPFRAALSGLANVRYVHKRERSPWGGLGVVNATLNGLRQILEDRHEGYVVLLSGQDYPLQPPARLRRFLAESRGAVFADVWALPYSGWYKGGLYRLTEYKFPVAYNGQPYLLMPWLFSRHFFSERREMLKKVGALVRNGIIPFRILRKRNAPKAFAPYGGSQWWAVPTNVAGEIVSFCDANKAYMAYHRFTLLADEVFFQGLLVAICKRLHVPLHPSLTHYRFCPGEPHPVVFSTTDLAELRKMAAGKPPKFFARKFAHDEILLDALDALDLLKVTEQDCTPNQHP